MINNQVVVLGDGRRLAYDGYGDPKGKPVFYFHGWPASRLSGTETHEAAKKLGIRVISPDRPGFGLSDFQKNRTLLDWADDMAELADKLKIKRFAVMGVSGGGPYAAACAYKIPNRVTMAGIIVGLSPTNIEGVMKDKSFFSKYIWTHFHVFPWLRMASSLVGIIIYRYLPFIGKFVGMRVKEDREIVKKRTYRSQKEAFRQGIKGPAWDLKLYSGDWSFKLKDIKTKVYLWYGAKDKNVSVEMGKYYHLQIPNSELFIDPTSGHMGRYNCEEVILKTLMAY